MTSLSILSSPRLGGFLLCGSGTLMPSAVVVFLCHGTSVSLLLSQSSPLVVVFDALASKVLCQSRGLLCVTCHCNSMALLACVISGSPLLISLVFWLPGPQKTCLPGNRSHFFEKRDECVRVYIYIFIHMSCMYVCSASKYRQLVCIYIYMLYTHYMSQYASILDRTPKP